MPSNKFQRDKILSNVTLSEDICRILSRRLIILWMHYVYYVIIFYDENNSMFVQINNFNKFHVNFNYLL